MWLWNPCSNAWKKTAQIFICAFLHGEMMNYRNSQHTNVSYQLQQLYVYHLHQSLQEFNTMLTTVDITNPLEFCKTLSFYPILGSFLLIWPIFIPTNFTSYSSPPYVVKYVLLWRHQHSMRHSSLMFYMKALLRAWRINSNQNLFLLKMYPETDQCD